MSLHRVDGEVERIGDFLQGQIEDVFENDGASLHDRKLREPLDRGFDRLLPHQRFDRIRTRGIDNFVGGLNGLGCPDCAAPQQIERAVVGDPKQPGP